jgi:hypothetical protein
MTLCFPHTIARRVGAVLLTTAGLGQYTGVFESKMPAHDIRMIQMSAARDTDKDEK